MTLLFAALVLAATLWPLARLGSEFMPPLDEGDLLYMPTALPGLAVGKAAEILQQTDRILKTFPEVQSVFGKMGRAESATDPAPLEMMETTLVLKPKSQWRPDSRPTASSKRWMPRCRFRAWRTSGCNRSAIASTCSPPASSRRSASRSRDPTSTVIERVGRDIEAAVTHGAGYRIGVRRACFRRAIHRDRARSRAHRALWTVDRRHATHRQRRRRRRERRRDRRRPAAISDQRALSARAARFGRGSARAADRDRARRNVDARRHRERRDHRRSADDQERERAPQRLDLRRHPRPRSRRLRCRLQSAPWPISSTFRPDIR